MFFSAFTHSFFFLNFLLSGQNIILDMVVNESRGKLKARSSANHIYISSGYRGVTRIYRKRETGVYSEFSQKRGGGLVRTTSTFHQDPGAQKEFIQGGGDKADHIYISSRHQGADRIQFKGGNLIHISPRDRGVCRFFLHN